LTSKGLESAHKPSAPLHASLARIANETEDYLLRYLAKGISKLLADGQKLAAFGYELFLKVLDHIEVTSDGMLQVIFLIGTKVAF
jgi:hypothetical protein